MTDERGIPPARARQIAEDMVGWAVLRHGDNLIAGRSAMIDRVIEIRTRLDDLYATVLNYDSPLVGTANRTSGPRDIDTQLDQLAQAYRDLDAEMTQLQLPFHTVPAALADTRLPRHLLDEIDNAPRSSTSSQTPRPHADDTRMMVQPDGGLRVRLTGIRYYFVRQADGSYLRTFTDGDTATLRMVNGWYQITTRSADGTQLSRFTEFDILHTPYGRKPRTSAVMQAHHGMQNSLMESLFSAYGYNKNSVPTMWLRNSRAGSPHGMITNAQHTRARTSATTSPAAPTGTASTPPVTSTAPPAAASVSPPGSPPTLGSPVPPSTTVPATPAAAATAAPTTGMTYSDIRQKAIEDFRLVDVPHARATEYLAAFDAYFERTVLPQLRSQGALHLLGTWVPQGGL
ncbi:hypothetical protein GQR58_002155 [Nymphon striatum]|nr:hypothetical protein GQR58_002155 [Nymphon striatum]